MTRQINAKYSYEDMKREAGETFQGGGAGIMSVYHKGKGQTGTHIVSMQNANTTGMTVDDPYDKMHEDYRTNKLDDAYALAGKGRTNSGLSNTKHNGDAGSDAADWKIRAAQNPSADESRGDSNHRSDEQVRSMLNYVTFFRRPSQRKTNK